MAREEDADLAELERRVRGSFDSFAEKVAVLIRDAADNAKRLERVERTLLFDNGGKSIVRRVAELESIEERDADERRVRGGRVWDVFLQALPWLTAFTLLGAWEYLKQQVHP